MADGYRLTVMVVLEEGSISCEEVGGKELLSPDQVLYLLAACPKCTPFPCLFVLIHVLCASPVQTLTQIGERLAFPFLPHDSRNPS